MTNAPLKTSFIVLEGGDGSGKTTLRKALFKAFAQSGRIPLCVAGVSWCGLDSTRVITKAKYKKVQFSTQAIMEAYLADRILLCERFIKPALAARDVITDRYLFSDAVYNKLHFGIDEDDTLRAYARQGLVEPGLLLFLDTPADIAVDRLQARGRSINHWETLEKQRRVHASFKTLLARNPLGWRCPLVSIDNTRPTEEVLAQTLRLIFGTSFHKETTS